VPIRKLSKNVYVEKIRSVVQQIFLSQTDFTVLMYMMMIEITLIHGQFALRLDYGRSPHAYVNQRLQIQLELLMMSGVPLETC
jgi:hypothetical protein